ncbi:hypothetical protein FGADI_9663 [Fusarium gaditjirri]|uniref:Uncharacterized protein n=1 Tax=Fusarium gaditjirri TaxID=282569 RepID=A0A8H4SZ75_9HYPO|nr:hypothetical protein FGADI_9663 [Fusarium gaditjirri]
MSSYLSFQWPNPQGVVCYRSFDNSNDHSIIAVKVPWLKLPNDPLEDVHSPWWVIREKSLAAVRLWKENLHRKLPREGDDHLKLFYGFAADEIAGMKEVKALDLGKDVVKWVGSGRDAVPVIRRVRTRKTDLV